MIIEKELRDWCADRSRQAGARAAAVAFAQSWSRSPSFRKVADAFRHTADSGEAVVETLCELFADHDWIEAAIDGLLAELRRDRFFEPPFAALNSDIHSGLLLYDDSSVSIALGVTGVTKLAAKKGVARGSTSIGFTGHHSVLKFIKAGGATISLWEAAAVGDAHNSSEAPTCWPVGKRELKDGDVLVFDGRRQSYVIEHATSDILLLQGTVKRGKVQLTTEYDSATLRYVGASATDEVASRVQMITTLLRKMKCTEAFPVIEQFLDDPHFFVRWHVMRELLGLDGPAALPHLERLASEDPHPDVRRAASAVLGGLQRHQPVSEGAQPCLA